MPRLTGSYVVSGTIPTARPTPAASSTLPWRLPSARADWNNGKQLGVGQVIGDVLVVGCLIKG